MLKKLILTISLCLAIAICFAQQRTSYQKQRNQAQLSEEQKIEQLKLNRFMHSDWTYLQDEALSRYFAWRTKGEFEKLSDYNERVLKYSEATYKEICFNILIAALAKVKVYGKIDKYDPENEFFSISFWVENYQIPQLHLEHGQRKSNKEYRLGYKTNFKVPISEAPSFKYNFEKLRIDVNPKDWNYIDGYIFPTKIHLVDGMRNKTYICEFPKGDQITHKLILNETGKYMEFDYSSIVSEEMLKSNELKNVKDLEKQIQNNKKKTILSELKELDGKYLSMLDLFAHQLLSKRLKELVHSDDEVISEITKAKGLISIIGNILRMKTPSGLHNETYLMINLDENLIYMGVRDGSNIRYYGEIGDNSTTNIPNEMHDWGKTSLNLYIKIFTKD